MPANDPWLWTVDDLVAEVCYTNALYKAAGCSATNIPNAAALEARFRNRHLTGKKFLTVLSGSSLVERNELNIPRHRQRTALMAVIELLRHRSYMYRQHVTTTGVRSLDINSTNTPPPVHPTGVSNDTAVPDEASRKRRKVTDLSTAPLRNAPPDSQGPSDVAAMRTSESGPSNTDDFSHLLKWQNMDGADQIIDLPDEDDLEDEDTSGLEDAAEDDALIVEDQNSDTVEEPNKRSKLSQDEIVEIINERIEFYTNAWVPNKGVARGEEVDYDPATMWNEAEAKGEREALAQMHDLEHAYFSQRLDRLCEEIVKDPGSNAVSCYAFPLTWYHHLTAIITGASTTAMQKSRGHCREYGARRLVARHI
jgi:hypothetical protein